MKALIYFVVLIAFVSSCSSKTTAAPTPPEIPASPTPDVVTPYTSAMAPLAREYIQEANLLKALIDNSNVKDPEWKKQFLQVASDIKSTGTKVRALNPPPCLASLHADYVDGSKNMDLAADNFTAAVNELNTVKIQLGQGYYNTAQNSFQSANEKLSAGCHA